MVGLEAPAKGTLEPPVGSDLDGGGCPAALQGVSGPLNGGGEPVVDVVVFIPYTAVGVEPSSHCCWSRTPLTLLLEFPHTAVGFELSPHCCWTLLTLLLELNFPHTAVGPSSHCCWS